MNMSLIDNSSESAGDPHLFQQAVDQTFTEQHGNSSPGELKPWLELQPSAQVVLGARGCVLLTEPGATLINYPIPPAWGFCPLQMYNTRSTKVSFPG